MTDLQARFYAYLLGFADTEAKPSYREMAEAMGVKSKASIVRLLRALEEQGLVTRSTKHRRFTVHRRDKFEGIASAEMIAELQKRGDLPNDG